MRIFPINSTKERKSCIASEVEGSGIDVPINRSTKEVHLEIKLSKGICVLFFGGQGIHRRIVQNLDLYHFQNLTPSQMVRDIKCNEKRHVHRDS